MAPDSFQRCSFRRSELAVRERCANENLMFPHQSSAMGCSVVCRGQRGRQDDAAAGLRHFDHKPPAEETVQAALTRLRDPEHQHRGNAHFLRLICGRRHPHCVYSDRNYAPAHNNCNLEVRERKGKTAVITRGGRIPDNAHSRSCSGCVRLYGVPACPAVKREPCLYGQRFRYEWCPTFRAPETVLGRRLLSGCASTSCINEALPMSNRVLRQLFSQNPGPWG